MSTHSSEDLDDLNYKLASLKRHIHEFRMMGQPVASLLAKQQAIEDELRSLQAQAKTAPKTEIVQAPAKSKRRKKPRKPKRSREKKTPPRPRTLLELATAIRGARPRGRKVPKLIKLIAEKIESQNQISIHFDDIRERCHDGEDVEDDAVKDTIQQARREVQQAKLPYTLSQCGYDLIVSRHPS